MNEIVHRTIMGATRSIPVTTQPDNQHWLEALLDATYKYSMIPHSSTNEIPFQLWHQKY